MKLIKGNIWDKYSTHKIVVTTNIGWDPVSFRNNMGAGIALQAALKFRDLPEFYGRYCAETAPSTPVLEVPSLGLILFPVKPLLDPDNPEISWDQLASLELIEKSLQELAQVPGNIALAFPGCGNGGLERSVVLPLLERYLCEDRFCVVDLAHEGTP